MAQTKPTNNPNHVGLERHIKVLISQMVSNPEYLEFLIIGTLVYFFLVPQTKLWQVPFLEIVFLLAGLMGIITVVRPVDRAFLSLGFDYGKGFGRPLWIISGIHPASQEILRIHAAGYSAADYEAQSKQLAVRLKSLIREIRQPVATSSILEVVLSRNQMPRMLSFGELPLGELKHGEFFLGKSDVGFEKLTLTEMIHMLVAGQTGMGKTSFLKQFLTQILYRTREAYVCLIDMKGGVDFTAFEHVPRFQMVTNYAQAALALNHVVELFEKRKAYLVAKKKERWLDLQIKDLKSEQAFKGLPIGPVIIVVDELAELSKRATRSEASGNLQDTLSSIARLARFTSIHLVLGTQRPDKSTIQMQNKDNIRTRVCFSVPSVAASTLVVGDMSASTLDQIPGRAVVQSTQQLVIQAPVISNEEIERYLSQSPYLTESSSEGYRGLMETSAVPPGNKPDGVVFT